jgi:iron complex outermembrane receptor protein
MQDRNKHRSVAEKSVYAMSPIAAAVAIAAFTWTHTAMAQDTDGNLRLEEVIITANKRAENLDIVPMSISVLSEEVLERNNVRDLDSILDLSPALTKTQSDNPANTGLNMRGIGTQSIGIGVESDVAVIVDDIPIGFQVQAFRDLTDVARIEILKGPQSTLFGKSAVAGAINIVTKPISGPVSTRTSLLLTSDGEWRVSGSIGGSVSDSFGFRIAGSTNDYPGNVNNLTTGEKTNGSTGRTLMAKFNWKPTDNFEVDFSPRYNYTKTDCCALVVTSATVTSGTGTPLLNNRVEFPISRVYAGITPSEDNLDMRNDTFTGQTSTDRGWGLRLTYALPNDMTLTSITSIGHYRAYDSRDQDFTDVPVELFYPVTVAGGGKVVGNFADINRGYEQHGIFDVRSKTQEIRLVSSDVGTLRYVAGLWYGKNELERYFKRGEYGVGVTNPTEFYGDTYNINTALYGQANWEFVPDFTLTTGLRLNQQESGYHFSGTGNPATLPFGSTTFVAVNNFESVGNKDKAVTGKVSLQYQFTPTLMSYISGSTGYKGQAYDITSGLIARTARQQPVKPETAKSFELGFKGKFFDERVSMAGTLFSTKFLDYQQNSGSYLPDTDPPVYQTRLNSIAGVETQGAELDINALVARNLQVNAAFAYTDATITSFRNATCYQPIGSPAGTLNANCIRNNPEFGNTNTNDVSGGRMPYSSVYKATLGLKYDIYDLSFAGNDLNSFITSTVTYQSDQISGLDQNPDFVNPGRTIVNAGFGFRDKASRYTLSFNVYNLMDERFRSNRLFPVGNFNASGANTPVTVVTNGWTPQRGSFRYGSVRFDAKF